jgi:hypothetical protein
MTEYRSQKNTGYEISKCHAQNITAYKITGFHIQINTAYEITECPIQNKVDCEIANCQTQKSTAYEIAGDFFLNQIALPTKLQRVIHRRSPTYQITECHTQKITAC